MAGDRFDLHVHSTASDGRLAPREVVALAAARGLAGIALTDHDTVDGLAEAAGMAAALELGWVPGIELSCVTDAGGHVHLLGYFIDPGCAALVDRLAELRAAREARAAEIVERIVASGVEITLDDVRAEAAGAPLGRPHIARCMVRAGVVATADDAFTGDWMGPGGAAYVAYHGMTLGEAISLVHEAGGAAVLAHPAARSRGGVRAGAVIEGAGAGLDGVEVDHPDHADDDVQRCVALAEQHDLLQTAGSDDHGAGPDGPRLGCRTVPARVVAQLRIRAGGVRPPLDR